MFPFARIPFARARLSTKFSCKSGSYCILLKMKILFVMLKVLFFSTMKLKLYFILNYHLMDVNKINIDVINYNIAIDKLSWNNFIISILVINT